MNEKSKLFVSKIGRKNSLELFDPKKGRINWIKIRLKIELNKKLKISLKN